MKIFWSWQSDTHQPSNRYFVRDVLGEVAKELNGLNGAEEADRPSDGDVEGAEDEVAADDDRILIDHDMKGLGGMPRIAERILEKIAAAAVFVVDVTPVAKTPGGKHVPNPNVMLELGYALRTLGEDRIVLVGNTFFDAALASVPFDLRHRSAPAFYTLNRETSDKRKAEVAAELRSELKARISPGLRLAQKLMRDDRRRPHPAPELALIVRREHDGPLAIGQTPRRAGMKTLAEVKAEVPISGSLQSGLQPTERSPSRPV